MSLGYNKFKKWTTTEYKAFFLLFRDAPGITFDVQLEIYNENTTNDKV